MTCEQTPTRSISIDQAQLLSTWHHEETGLLISCSTLPAETIFTAHTMLSEMKTAWPDMYGHCIRTASIAQSLARRLDLPAEERDQLTIAALLHDFGKTGLEKEFSHYENLEKPEQDALRIAHVRNGFEAIRDRIGKEVASIMVAHHEFPQPVCRSYPRNKNIPEEQRNGNERRITPDASLEQLQALCALADQIDAMTDETRPRNNGLQLIQTESHILTNIQSGQYWPESIRPLLPELVHEALTVLNQRFLTRVDRTA